MIIRLTASNLVGMILFIPILLALGLVLAFIVPLLAIIIAVIGIIFTFFYMAGLGRRRKKPGHIEVTEYKVK